MKVDNPPPVPSYNSGRPNRYPFVDMKPGDYEIFEFESEHQASIAQRCAHVTSRKNGYKFVTRKNKTRLEVWCVAG